MEPFKVMKGLDKSRRFHLRALSTLPAFVIGTDVYHNLWLFTLALQNAPCVLAVPVLNQTPISDPVSAGETSELKCAMQNGNVGSYYMYWYRQRPGEAPVWVLAHYTSGSIYRGTGFTDRFKPSRDTSSNSHILTIGSLEPGDSAVYYCAANDGSAATYTNRICPDNGENKLGQIFIFLSTDSVLGIWILEGSEDRKPSVLLLPPSSEEIDSGWATLSCLVSRFKPGFVRVLWRVDDKETDSGVTTGTVSTDSDQTYSLSSYLRVPATAWNKGSSYTCSVDHGSLSSPLLKTISSTACSD
ncbi:immunoglobulin lambda-1 light chain-like [Heterodontus francisci]|uniref:immunoglobulin lambda-1 light chain-like n=1 Tax=Heterodontus francisci TaxID=7792 RepID=UPI00355BF397